MPDPTNDSSLEELEQLVSEDPELALELLAALPPALRDDPDLLLLEAEAHAAGARWADSIQVLQRALQRSPEDADVHHLLGVAFGELDDLPRCRTHFLKALELDSEAAPHAELSEADAEGIAGVAQRVLEELPVEYRERLGNVLVVLEERPAREIVAEGFDPRAYGLFEGLDHAEQLNNALPNQITRVVLFAVNLLADFPDPEELAEEIRITVLHEVGHYFGLDEDDMVRLGLD